MSGLVDRLRAALGPSPDPPAGVERLSMRVPADADRCAYAVAVDGVTRGGEGRVAALVSAEPDPHPAPTGEPDPWADPDRRPLVARDPGWDELARLAADPTPVVRVQPAAQTGPAATRARLLATPDAPVEGPVDADAVADPTTAPARVTLRADGGETRVAVSRDDGAEHGR